MSRARQAASEGERQVRGGEVRAWAASEGQHQLPREETAPSRRRTGKGRGRGLLGRGLKTSLPAPLHFLVREGG